MVLRKSLGWCPASRRFRRKMEHPAAQTRFGQWPAAALDAFEAGHWGQKYAGIVRSGVRRGTGWCRSSCLGADPACDLHDQRDREPEQRGASGDPHAEHLPNDQAATKLIYLALRGVERKWRAPPDYRHAARRSVRCRASYRRARRRCGASGHPVESAFCSGRARISHAVRTSAPHRQGLRTDSIARGPGVQAPP